MNKKIAVDIIACNSDYFDLVTFSPLATLTGGNIKYYTYEEPEAKQSFEKLHYDINRILTQPIYYEVSFTARCSKELEILNSYGGSINSRKGVHTTLSACDPDYSFCFTYKIKDKLLNNKRV